MFASVTCFLYGFSKEDSTAVTINTKDVTIETNTPDISDVYVFKGTKRTATDNEKKDQIELYTYTFADLFQSDIDVKKNITINGTTKLEFTLPDYGEYFVYLRKINKCWFFKCYDPNQITLQNSEKETNNKH